MPHALRGLRVLVAEDNEVNMLITVALLEQWGLVVAQARDGATAVQRVIQAHRDGRPFDIVLMDVHMPVMDGHQAAHRLRRDFNPVQLPIIALTASVLVSERQQALAAGMDAVLSKPVQSLLLQAELQRLTARRRAADDPLASPPAR
jgi:CheY-like chemotaxis protein